MVMFKSNKIFAFSYLILQIFNVLNCCFGSIDDSDLLQQQRSQIRKINISTSTSTPTPSTSEKVTFDEREEYGHHSEVQFNCGQNEVYTKCVKYCQPSCEELNKTCEASSYCYAGCECAPGFVKDHQNWTCIPKEQCPKCPTNEHFRYCGNGCPPTCSNYQNMPVYCSHQNTHNCKRGCFCDYGFVRDPNRNNICVRVEECPQKCGPNEYYDESGPPCIRTADNPRPKCLDEPPKPTCICNTGFIKNTTTGLCQPLAHFVESCPRNETFSYCGSECATGACHYRQNTKFCPTVCNRGCFCDRGYVRDEYTGKCVLPTDCQKNPY